MHTHTLIRALFTTRQRMDEIAAVRGSDIGIAIRHDRLARRWQRYNRLALKLTRTIRSRGGWTDPDAPRCVICGNSLQFCRGHRHIHRRTTRVLAQTAT